MVAAYRREAILELARQGSELRVEEIARQFNVSRETVRRDLGRLQSQGLLRRVHGGAMPAQTGWEAAFRQRMVDNASAKRRIAALAASLFRQNDTLMIDTGTTTLMLAAELASAPKLTVITNSFGVARQLGARVRAASRLRRRRRVPRGDRADARLGLSRADRALPRRPCGAELRRDRPGRRRSWISTWRMRCVARAMIDQAESVTLIVDQLEARPRRDGQGLRPRPDRPAGHRRAAAAAFRRTACRIERGRGARRRVSTRLGRMATELGVEAVAGGAGLSDADSRTSPGRSASGHTSPRRR